MPLCDLKLSQSELVSVNLLFNKTELVKVSISSPSENRLSFILCLFIQTCMLTLQLYS